MFTQSCGELPAVFRRPFSFQKISPLISCISSHVKTFLAEGLAAHLRLHLLTWRPGSEWLGMAWRPSVGFYAQVLSFWLMGALIMDASQRYSGFSLVFSCMFSMMYCTFCCFTSWHVRAGHACCSPRTQESDCLHAMERCRCELIS